MFNLDFSKFGDSFNEALEKAKADLEKGVDDALGIAGRDGVNTSSGDLNGTPPVEAGTSKAGPVASSSGHVPEAADSSAPSGTTKKKVAKKVVKKVVKTVSLSAGKAEDSPKAAKAIESSRADAPPTGLEPSATQGGTIPCKESKQKSHASPDGPSERAVLEPAEACDSDPCGTGSSPFDLPGDLDQASNNDGDAWGESDDLQLGSALDTKEAAVPQSGPEDLSPADKFRSSGQPNGREHIDAHASLSHDKPYIGNGIVSRSGGEHCDQEYPASEDVSTKPSVDAQPVEGQYELPVLPALLPSEDIPELYAMDKDQLLAVVAQLREVASSREQQLIRQAEQMSTLNKNIAALQEKNEGLALKSAKMSEQDFEEIRNEFEQRLGAAERKVYALTKERDALKKGAEKLTDYGNLIREKDAIIKQVMEEGEQLASKQEKMEGTMRKLRQQITGLEGELDKLSNRLAAEHRETESLRKAKAKIERELAAAHEQAKSDLDSQKQQMDQMLLKAKADQVDAEERAREVASQGLARKLKDSEGRCEALTESVVELREALERQRQAADLREEMLKQDISDLERRCHAAEIRHQELTSKMPEATRPLLRQIEAMQAAAEAQQEAWEGAERTLSIRIADAESRAAGAVERERLTTERSQVLSSRVGALEASLAEARAEAKRLSESIVEQRRDVDLKEDTARILRQQLDMLEERYRIAMLQAEQAAQAAAEALAFERNARHAAEADAVHVRRQCEDRMAEAEAELGSRSTPGGMNSRDKQKSDGAGGEPPPAMAAPGYHWVLVRDGEQPHQQQQNQYENMPDSSVAERGQHGKADEAPDKSAGGRVVSELSQHSGVSASEVEDLRASLRIAKGEMSSMEARIQELQASRDRLAEELVAMAQKSDQAINVLYELEDIKQELADTRARYIAAVELLGERDESLDELRADLMDVKHMYKDQIEFMCAQLADIQATQNPVVMPPVESAPQ